MTAIQSPLHDRHVAAGAKFGEFGGWEMPLEYAGGGVLAEHAAVREHVGVFDVSHLGTIQVTGPGSAALVNRLLTNDLGRIGPGRAQYTLACLDDGGVLDDLIVYLHGDDDVLLVPNAANSAAVLRRFSEAAPDGVAVVDQHRSTAILAVQGPRSRELLGELGLPAGMDYMAFSVARAAGLHGLAVTVCRTGYTGEHGYELMCAAADAGRLWDALLSTGRGLHVRPVGLGARDTLRTEMGYPLHGQDLSPTITPVQAGLSWAVGWDKPDFVGAAALRAEREAGPRRRLRGILLTERGVPRPGMSVLRDSETIGELTSGTFSPTLQAGIGLALLGPETAVGDVVSVDVRGRPVAARVVAPPFVDVSPA